MRSDHLIVALSSTQYCLSQIRSCSSVSRVPMRWNHWIRTASTKFLNEVCSISLGSEERICCIEILFPASATIFHTPSFTFHSSSAIAFAENVIPSSIVISLPSGSISSRSFLRSLIISTSSSPLASNIFASLSLIGFLPSDKTVGSSESLFLNSV